MTGGAYTHAAVDRNGARDGRLAGAVNLGRKIRQHLRRFFAGRTTGPVFCAWGRRWRLSARHVQRRLGEWLRKAGIARKASPHSLRHSMAVRLYARTRDILVVKEALRHRSITNTMVYARVSEERVRQAVEASPLRPWMDARQRRQVKSPRISKVSDVSS